MFCRIWQEGPCYLLSKILSALPRSFGDSFNTSCYANCCPRTSILFAGETWEFGYNSAHLFMPTAVLKQFFSPARYLGVFFFFFFFFFFFGIRSALPLTATSILKNKFFIPISSDEKGTTSGAKALANHLAPSSSSSSSRATQWPTFLLHPPSYGVLVVWPLYPTASAVSRWAVSSNTEGEGGIKSHFSPLSGISRDTIV